MYSLIKEISCQMGIEIKEFPELHSLEGIVFELLITPKFHDI